MIDANLVFTMIRTGALPGADAIDDSGQPLFTLATLLAHYRVDARDVIRQLERDGVRLLGQRLNA